MTAGQLTVPRGGRDVSDAEVTVDLSFTAPEAPGELWIGAVLRDDRGGVGFEGHRVVVE